MLARILGPLAFLALAFMALVVATPAFAQDGDWVGPPTDLPAAHHGSKTENLDFLFGALKVAPDDDSAKAIERRIWAHWIVSKSDTTNLLMSRVKIATEAKDTGLAVRLLDSVVELDPTYVEGWNRLATIHYMRKEFGEAMVDIRRVLALEPRHFGALTGLGLILQEIGDDKQALEVFRKALALNPHLEKVPDMVKSLSEKVDGRNI